MLRSSARSTTNDKSKEANPNITPPHGFNAVLCIDDTWKECMYNVSGQFPSGFENRVTLPLYKVFHATMARAMITEILNLKLIIFMGSRNSNVGLLA